MTDKRAIITELYSEDFIARHIKTSHAYLKIYLNKPKDIFDFNQDLLEALGNRGLDYIRSDLGEVVPAGFNLYSLDKDTDFNWISWSEYFISKYI